MAGEPLPWAVWQHHVELCTPLVNTDFPFPSSFLNYRIFELQEHLRENLFKISRFLVLLHQQKDFQSSGSTQTTKTRSLQCGTNAATSKEWGQGTDSDQHPLGSPQTPQTLSWEGLDNPTR